MENGTTTVKQKSSVTIKAPARTKEKSRIEVPDIETAVVPLTIVGLSPLIVRDWDPKMRAQIEEGPRGIKDKTILSPEDEAEAGKIRDPKGRDAVYGRWIKAAIVTASSLTDKMVSAKVARGTIYVMDEFAILQYSSITVRTDICRVGRFGSKQPCPRHRAQYNDWSTTFKVQYEPRKVSLGQLIYLVRRAGLNIGLCEWRPEKNGEFGRFDLKLQDMK